MINKYKELVATSKWKNLEKVSVIQGYLKDIVFRATKENFTITVSKNDKLSLFTLERVFPKSELGVYNSKYDEDTKVELSNTEILQETRIWTVPLEYLDEIINIFDTIVNEILETKTKQNHIIVGVKDYLRFREVFDNILLKIFDYDVLKVLVGEFDTKLYEERVKEVVSEILDTNLLSLATKAYEKERKELVDVYINDAAYKEMEILNVDKDGKEHYEYSTSYREFTECVEKLKHLTIVKDIDILFFNELKEKAKIEFEKINKIRMEEFKKLKEKK